MFNESSSQTTSGLAPLDRLSLLTSLVLVGLTLSLILDLPSRRIAFSFLGSEASFTLSGTWVIAIVLAALTAAGVNSIVRAHPRVHLIEARYISILWIVPALIAVTATMLLSFADVRAFGVYALIGVVAAGIILIGVIVGEYLTIDLNDRWYSAARLGVNIAAYFVGLIFFSAIFSLKLRSLFSSPAIGIAAGLLALELLRGSESDFWRTWLYAATVGLIMAELVWALNYWGVKPWGLTGITGGGLLLIFFYLLTGITQQYLWKRLSRVVFIEFGIIFVGALALLFWIRPH